VVKLEVLNKKAYMVQLRKPAINYNCNVVPGEEKQKQFG
jgi:hypothetical protein